MPLREILELLQKDRKAEIEKYLKFKAHVCRQVYADVDKARQRLSQKEKQWPEYEGTQVLVSRPSYLSQRCNASLSTTERIVEGNQWLEAYEKHVQEIQEFKQHHIHLPTGPKGELMPLTHCRRADNPALCKSDFPRLKWLIGKAVVLCQGLLERMGMAVTGRRSKLGSLHGPMNHESLNGAAPAMLATQQCNSDVQLPYRLPICPETHSSECPEACWETLDEACMVEACQCSQDAQAGYACDYCSKRQPMAFNEVKECCKGHCSLNESLAGERVNYIGKRHATRFMSDAYGKGIVRGQAENTNLRAYSHVNDVTFAETMKTSRCVAFHGKEYLQMVERLNDAKTEEHSTAFAEVDYRNPRKRRVTLRDVCVLYGQRPKHEELWLLSPYEFVMYWEPTLVTYPLDLEEEQSEAYHAELTDSGRRKLHALNTDLQAGRDYEVKDGGVDWVAFPRHAATKQFRHTWVLVRKKRPEVPTFFGAPVPRHSSGEHQRAAAIVMSYFHPWTLREGDADEHVKYAGGLRASDESWQDAMQTWLDGNVLC